jgi:hypothetical protein
VPLLGLPSAEAPRLAPYLTTILPAMTLADVLDTTRIPRVAGLTGGDTFAEGLAGPPKRGAVSHQSNTVWR